MKIIVFEGIDASGKETQVNMLKRFLEGRGFNVKTEAFPRYNTPVGELIGRVLRGELEMGSMAFHTLYEVDRLDFQSKIINYKDQGIDYLILDRYYLSNIAYMIANNLPFEWLSSLYQGLIHPDLTFVLDIDVDTSYDRRWERKDLFEKNYCFLMNVSNAYRKICEKVSSIEIIKSDNLTPDAICETVKRKLLTTEMIDLK